MKKYRVVLWIVILVELAVIFGFSCQNLKDSVALSDSVVSEQQKISETVFDGGLDYVDDFIEVHIRSMAHAVLYFILGASVFIQARFYGSSPLKAAAIAVVCCFVYGLTDEFHQRFSDQRTSSLGDVFIDTAGACVGAAIVFVGEKIIKGVRK